MPCLACGCEGETPSLWPLHDSTGPSGLDTPSLFLGHFVPVLAHKMQIWSYGSPCACPSAMRTGCVPGGGDSVCVDPEAEVMVIRTAGPVDEQGK